MNVFTLKEGKAELIKFIVIIALAIICTVCVITVPALKTLFGFNSANTGTALIYAIVYVVVKIAQEFLKKPQKSKKKAEVLNGTDI